MAYMIEFIDEAVDHKFIVTSHQPKQAKPGTMIHIMAGFETEDGVTVNYRVTDTRQDFTIHFSNVKQFCKWCRPDSFIARHYESLNPKEIIQYMKITGRTVVSYCLPLIIVMLVIIWLAAMLLMSAPINFILGGVLSVVAIAGILFLYKRQKTQATVKIYNKVSSKWSVVIK